MKNLFSNAILKAGKAGIGIKSKTSMNWFRQYVKTNIRSAVSVQQLLNATGLKHSTRLRLGHMYFFAYDAKHKATLPYWDASPLMIPIHDNGQTITGLNFHYLPLKYRAKLMDALYDLLSDEKMDQNTKLKMTYNMLKSSARYKYFKPCIKQYLKTNIRSQFVEVPIAYWETAIFLPVAQFQGASSATVFKESTEIIKNS